MTPADLRALIGVAQICLVVTVGIALVVYILTTKDSGQ